MSGDADNPTSMLKLVLDLKVNTQSNFIEDFKWFIPIKTLYL